MNISMNNGFTNFFGKPKRQGFGLGSFLFLLIFGLVFTGAGLLFVKDELLSLKWPTTDGTVIDVATSRSDDGDRMYRPTVQYTVGGQAYSVTSGASSSTVRTPGDRMTVAYEQNNPSHGVLRSSGADLFVYIFPVVGITVIIIGIVSFIRSLRRSHTINDLQQRGVKTQGVVTDVQGGTSNQAGVRIVVSATGPDGQVKDYLSDYVAGNTFSLLDFRTHPIPMDVYIDPSNPENYYVDISDIPSLTTDKIASLLQQATGTQSVLPPTPGTPPPIDVTPTSTPIEKDRRS